LTDGVIEVRDTFIGKFCYVISVQHFTSQSQ